MTVTRLLETYVHFLQTDYKSAALTLREALLAQSQSSKMGSTLDLAWYFRVVIVLYYNFACVSLAQRLRTEAVTYILKAEQVLKQTQGCSRAMEGKIIRFRMQLAPSEEDEIAVQESVEPPTQPPFLPGGYLGDPGKLVELTREAPHSIEKKPARKLPKRLALLQLFSKDNPYVQHIASVKSSKRYHSVQPSLRFP